MVFKGVGVGETLQGEQRRKEQSRGGRVSLQEYQHLMTIGGEELKNVSGQKYLAR